MKLIKNGICAVDGFEAVGKHIGIKKVKKDFAVIYSDRLCSAAGVFTSNKVKGAPVVLTQKYLKDGKAQAIVINSGISNVATGKKGYEDAVKMSKLGGVELDVDNENVLVASTGLIGAYLPMDKIEWGIKGVKDELVGDGSDASEAILTTDKVVKEIAVDFGGFKVGGIAKGSGMIHPNMATMLGFITTDAKISAGNLKKMLKRAVDKSFNMVSVDMQTSTSDMVLIMANGNAGEVSEGKFQDVLDFVCLDLAKKIAKDGEGATKLIEVNVKGGPSTQDAKKIAKSIVSSDLFKCAVYGNDPNWGRIMCAIGNSKAEFSEEKIDIYFNGVKIVNGGVGVDFKKEKVINSLKKGEVKVIIDLNEGRFEATAYGCDMSEEYVKINADNHS